MCEKVRDRFGELWYKERDPELREFFWGGRAFYAGLARRACNQEGDRRAVPDQLGLSPGELNPDTTRNMVVTLAAIAFVYDQFARANPGKTWDEVTSTLIGTVYDEMHKGADAGAAIQFAHQWRRIRNHHSVWVRVQCQECRCEKIQGDLYTGRAELPVKQWVDDGSAQAWQRCDIRKTAIGSRTLIAQGADGNRLAARELNLDGLRQLERECAAQFQHLCDP